MKKFDFHQKNENECAVFFSLDTLYVSTFYCQNESGLLADNHGFNSSFIQCWHKSSFKWFPSPKIELKPTRRSIDRNSWNSGSSFSAWKRHLSQDFAEITTVSWIVKNCIWPLFNGCVVISINNYNTTIF